MDDCSLIQSNHRAVFQGGLWGLIRTDLILTLTSLWYLCQQHTPQPKMLMFDWYHRFFLLITSVSIPATSLVFVFETYLLLASFRWFICIAFVYTFPPTWSLETVDFLCLDPMVDGQKYRNEGENDKIASLQPKVVLLTNFYLDMNSPGHLDNPGPGMTDVLSKMSYSQQDLHCMM